MIEKNFLINSFQLRVGENVGEGNPEAECLIVYDSGDLTQIKSITSFLGIGEKCWYLPHLSSVRLQHEFIGIIDPKLIIEAHTQTAKVYGKIWTLNNKRKLIYTYAPSEMVDKTTKQKAKECWNKALTILNNVV